MSGTRRRPGRARATSFVCAAIATLSLSVSACSSTRTGTATGDGGSGGFGGGGNGAGGGGSNGSFPFSGPSCPSSDPCFQCSAALCQIGCASTACASFYSCYCPCQPLDSACHQTCNSQLDATCLSCLQSIDTCDQTACPGECGTDAG